jgi:hypothetical protein
VSITVRVNTSAIDKVQNQIDRLSPRGLTAGLGAYGRSSSGRGGLLGNAGDALITSIVKGLERGQVKVGTVLDKLGGYIQKRQDKLAALLDKRSALVDSLRGFTTSIFSADISSQEGAPPATIQRLLDFQAQMRTNAEQLAANVKTLTDRGLSKDLIQQLVGAGESGQAQIALLAGGSAEQIAQANRDNAATQAALTAAGLTASRGLGVDADIREEQRNIRLAKAIEDALDRWAEKKGKQVDRYVFELKGRDLVATLEKHQRLTNT